MNNFIINGPLSKQDDSLEAYGCRIRHKTQPMFPMTQLQILDHR